MSISSDFMSIGSGHKVSLKVANEKHFDEKPQKVADDDVSGSFKDMLSESIGKVNDLQVQSDELTQKMIYEPESVDIHTVMIAAQKAELALSFTKAVRDEAIKAYKELINLR
jgi:flagellar hook-basal body complex protein FliE